MYYGITRNVHGLYDKRYIYEEKQLEKIEQDNAAEGHATSMGFNPDGYEGAFWGDDTYSVVPLKDLEEVRAFITADGEADMDEPTVGILREYYWELMTEDMFTGLENPTTVQVIKELGLTEDEMWGVDPYSHYIEDFNIPKCYDDRRMYEMVEFYESTPYSYLKAVIPSLTEDDSSMYYGMLKEASLAYAGEEDCDNCIGMLLYLKEIPEGEDRYICVEVNGDYLHTRLCSEMEIDGSAAGTVYSEEVTCLRDNL